MKRGRIYHRGTGAAKMRQAEAEHGDAEAIIASDPELKALQTRFAKKQKLQPGKQRRTRGIPIANCAAPLDPFVTPMDDLNRRAGICPSCGAEVEPSWALCDECGKRLPWAPSQTAKTHQRLSRRRTRRALCREASDSDAPGWVSVSRIPCPEELRCWLSPSLLWAICNQLFFHLY